MIYYLQAEADSLNGSAVGKFSHSQAKITPFQLPLFFYTPEKGRLTPSFFTV